MSKLERGIANVTSYFEQIPTENTYSYVPVPNPEIHFNGESSLGSSIRLIEQELDSQNVWSRVEQWLEFWKTNVARHSDPLAIKDQIQMVRLSYSGYGERLLAASINEIFIGLAEKREKPYGRSQIKYFRERVITALNSVLTEEEKKKIGFNSTKKSKNAEFIDQIYETYPQIPELIEQLLENKEFATVWKRNPHFAEIIDRFLKGETFFEIAVSAGYKLEEIKNTPVILNSINGANESIKSVLLYGEYNGRSFYTMLRRIVFAKYLNFGLSWHDKYPEQTFHKAITQLLETENGGHLKRFIEIIPALDYLQMLINLSPTNRSSEKLEENFPGFKIKDGQADMTTISKKNINQYFEKFNGELAVSPGITALTRHCMAGGPVQQVATSLRSKQIGFQNSQAELEMIIGKGLFFIEKILLNKDNLSQISKKKFQQIFEQSSKQDISFLMKAIAEKIKASDLANNHSS